MSKHVNGRIAAFSLVELLLVVAVITLLIAILLPVLGRARDGVYTDVCQNNLRNIMQGCMQYAFEHGRILPSPNWGGYAVDTNGWTGGGWLYHNQTGGQITLNSQWNMDLLRTGNLFPYVGSTESYRCPQDKPPYVPLSGQLTSYNMNGSSISYGQKVTPFAIDNFSQQAVLFWEVDAENFTTGWWWDGGNYPWEGLSQSRHFEGGTIVNVDLSTDRWDHVDYYTEEARRPGRLWNVPTANGSSWPE